MKLVLAFAFTATLVAGITPVRAISRFGGGVRLGTADWQVADAIAYQHDDGIAIAFLSSIVDQQVMRSDGKVDTSDLLRAGVDALSINVAEDGPTTCIDLIDATQDTPKSSKPCDAAFRDAITITAKSARRIAGEMHYRGENGDSVDLVFDLPIEPDLAKAVPLPANGGEPGEAVLAYFAAMDEGDWAKIVSVMHPDRRAEMQALAADPAFKDVFEVIRSVRPRGVKVASGRLLDADTAQVEITGTDENGRPMQATAEVARAAGVWFFVSHRIHH